MLENISVPLFFYQELRRKALTRMFLMETVSFSAKAIIACGTLRMELTRMQEKGFLDTEHVFCHPRPA